MFASFDETPLASASLAQVHRATLKDGTQVAVKVQHPKVYTHAFVDMATMEVRLELNNVMDVLSCVILTILCV